MKFNFIYKKNHEQIKNKFKIKTIIHFQNENQKNN